jgi:NAD(P)H-hydrate epimerase
VTTPAIFDHHLVPGLSTKQMIEVDRAMIEDFGIQLIQMMENAGRNLADLARGRFLDGDPRGKRVTVLAGSGGNGGGALVAARRLHNWGAAVAVTLAQPATEMTAVPAHQLDILERMSVPIIAAESVASLAVADVVLDGLIGYSLKGPPRGAAAELIEWANRQNAPLLALDVPSGVDADTGIIFDPAIRASATMTLALPKLGLLGPGVEAHVGELYLADLSVPPGLYQRPPLDIRVEPLFARAEVIRLR